MYRQSLASRLCTSFGQQRKLFLLVFLWTCLCLMIFKSTLFSGGSPGLRREKLFARSPLQAAPDWLPAGSSAAPLYLAPEFALPDNSNNYYYSLASAPAGQQAQQRQVEPANKQQAPSDMQTQSEQPKRGHHKQQEAVASQEQAPSVVPHLPQAKQQEKPSKPAEQAIAGGQCHYEYPLLIDLQFSNIHWQKMSNRANSTSAKGINPEASYYLYNAYYDDRWRQGLPSVRVLAMIDRIQPPATNCLLWSSKLRDKSKLKPIVTRASFVYAWYPKWGNYKDGILQPWIVTCPLPRSHLGLVPDSVSLVEVPTLLDDFARVRRETVNEAAANQASMAMPAPFSSSSSSPSVSAAAAATRDLSTAMQANHQQQTKHEQQYDCNALRPITNNLPVFNQRPAKKGKFAVCVKGLDFPHEDVSVRLVEWIELLNLLGAGKIFLYNLDVHENISKVLHYYEQRGIVELSPLTLPGDQPNLPEYQHLYLKSKLTAKRQNELIPYNDCLYRNLNSYQYLALLDIDEIIMPLRHQNWYDLMHEVEALSLAEQNYSRASYNVRNVYFFDDLAGPLGTTSSSSSSSSSTSDVDEDGSDEAASSADDNERQVESLERGIPHYLHMMQHVYRSKNYTKPGQYVKCFHNTERVVSLHNHFPMNCFGQCTTYSIPVHLAHLQHYRKDCVGPLKQSCKNDFRVFTQRDTTIWKYKQQMIRRTTRVLHHLNLLAT